MQLSFQIETSYQKQQTLKPEIATLTGENGILTQAKKAKNDITKAEAKERIQLEVLGSYGTDGEIDIAILL